MASAALRVGFVDNMGGRAGALAELQFRRLLGASNLPLDWLRIATRAQPVVGCDIAAYGRTVQHARDAAALPALDLLVFSGAEPLRALPEEPFWPGFTALLDHAEASGCAVLLSCLAAHAAVLHRDGLRRVALAEKCTGVFRFLVNAGHWLAASAEAASASGMVAVPHSRCNELPAWALEAAGYERLTGSSEGIDMATARGRPWLLLQGHPEYTPATLIEQFRRDIGRFLRGERAGFPNPPLHCLSGDDEACFAAFAELALAAPAASRTALLEAVPQAGAARQAFGPAEPADARRLVVAWLETLASRIALTADAACRRKAVHV